LLVPPRDGSALGEAVAAILSDSDLRARLVEGGRRRVLDFSVERTAEKTVGVYRRVLSS
jgi:glycosyltransferase involved in cell wall biosynthesis